MEFVFGFPWSKGFTPGPLVFLFPQKPTLQMSFDLETVDVKSHLMVFPLLNAHYENYHYPNNDNDNKIVIIIIVIIIIIIIIKQSG